MNTIKKIIQITARRLGIQISSYRPANSSASQLAKALEICGINLVFDIGANKGQFAKEIREFGYTGKIVSFEPLSSARINLLKNASKDSLWVVHDQIAIGDQDGRIEINIAGNSASSSILPMLDSHSNAAVGSAYIAAEMVPIDKLDKLASIYLDQESKLFIKIDTQGYEWQVLDGAHQTLQRAFGVLCELSLVPLYDGQRLWRDIIDRLESEGFVLWALQKGFTDPRTGQSLQMDGIFLRRDVLNH